MIITRTPFRISFAGGGSDIAAFYQQHDGAVISTTINKYMYISAHPYFENDRLHLKYSKSELVDHPEKIDHRIFKTILSDLSINGIEISSVADIPSGTGLGSSSSFTVGLWHCMNAYLCRYVSKEQLAELACDVEINQLKEPIGKQDQYAAAFGGLNLIRFLKNGRVDVEPIMVSKATKQELDNNLLMFFTGVTRASSSILSEQTTNMNQSAEKVENLRKMVDLTFELKESLENDRLDQFGLILDKCWSLKQSLASGITNNQINKLYQLAIENGALGGKLLGAGGGGYLLFYVPPDKREKVRSVLSHLKQLDFSFTNRGSEIVFFEHH